MENRGSSASLIDIREFLQQQKIEIAPWAAPDEVTARLHGALADRAGDRRFWRDLRRLVGRLDERRFDPAPLRGTRVLREDDLGQLVDDLRTALGENGDGSRRFWLHRGVSAAAVAGFLILGSALGCADLAERADGNGGTRCNIAAKSGLFGFEARVLCQLVSIVSEAGVGADVRRALYECLPELSASRREKLYERFGSLNDEALAQELEDMATTGECAWAYGNEDDDTWDDEGGH